MTLTNVARLLIGAVRNGGPVLVAFALVALAVDLTSRAGRTRLLLAHFGLSEAQPSGLRRIVAGTLVPALGVAALCVSLSLEQEVREGPNRMIDSLAQGHLSDTAWVLQRGTNHFMNDSRLPSSLATAAQSDPAAYPLWEQLATVASAERSETGLVLGIADKAGPSPLSPTVNPATATCRLVQNRCELSSGQAVADRAVFRVGARVLVRDRQITVVANTSQPYSLINRAVIFLNASDFTRTDGSQEDPYAVVLSGPDAGQRATRLVNSVGLNSSVQVVAGDTLKAENATFWAGNGTPLLLLVICLSGAFCGVALYAARRATHRREHVPLGTLQALGLCVVDVCRIDLLRTTLAILVATILGAPVAYLLLGVVNAGMLGFHAEVTPMFLLSASGLLIFASVLGTGMMYLRIRHLSVVEAITQP